LQTISQHTAGCPYLFAPHKKAFSLNFLCHFPTCTTAGVLLWNSLTSALCTVSFDHVGTHYET